MQNVGHLITTPLVLFGSIILFSTLLLYVNIIQRGKESRKLAIPLMFGIRFLMTFFYLIFSLRNVFGYIKEVLIGNGLSILFVFLFVITNILIFQKEIKARVKMKIKI